MSMHYDYLREIDQKENNAAGKIKNDTKSASELWSSFKEVPKDANGNIKRSWNGFEKGTPYKTICEWFQEEYFYMAYLQQG